MRVLPVSDRIKEAPAQALRGVFAGIGQLLLITDKLRNKTPADQHVPQARGPEPAESAAEAHEVTVVQDQAAASEAAGATGGGTAGATGGGTAGATGGGTAGATGSGTAGATGSGTAGATGA